MNKLILALIVPSALLAQSGASQVGFRVTGGTVQTNVDAVLNAPFLYDTGFRTAALACESTKTIAVTSSALWQGLSTASCAAPLWFPAGAGFTGIKPASGQTITLTGTIDAPAVQIFDLSAGGVVAIPDTAPAVIQWWGVSATATAANNLANGTKALAAATVLRIPQGTYQFSGVLLAPRNGQRILCEDAQTTILQFTGATSGIRLYRAGAAQIFTEVSGCNLQTTSASGSSALLVDADTLFPSSHAWVHDNSCTTSGSGNWAKCYHFIANQGAVVERNRAYGEIDKGYAYGDGATAVTHIMSSHNVIGALKATAIGVDLQFAQDMKSDHDYCQSAPMAKCWNVDAASDIILNDGDCDIQISAATNCVFSDGIVEIIGLRASGQYVNFIDAHGGSLRASKLAVSVTASSAVLKLETGSPGSGVDSSPSITNNHATGDAILVAFGTDSYIKTSYISTLAGACVAMQQTSVSTNIEGNECHSATGKGVKIDNGVNTFNLNWNRFYGMSLASVCGNCDFGAPPILSGKGNWLDGTGYILDGDYVGGNVTSAATIVPTSALFHVTGTVATSVMTPPFAGFSGCVNIIADAAWPWSTGGGAGGFSVAGTATAGKLYRFCYDGTFAKRLWYGQ